MITTSAGEEDWRCSFSNGDVTADANTPTRGGTGDGFRPHELLEASLATCLNMTARMVAADADVDLEDVRTSVDLTRTAERATFAYGLELEGVTEREAETIRRGVADCPVHETLEKTLSFEPLDADSRDRRT